MRRPISFFLHTPWPEHYAIAAVPNHTDLARAMLAYDLIGFQTEDDRRRFESYLSWERIHRGTAQLGVFPVAIDADAFTGMAARAANQAEVRRLRDSAGRLVLGVDSLDYSKGLLHKLYSIDCCWPPTAACGAN